MEQTKEMHPEVNPDALSEHIKMQKRMLEMDKRNKNVIQIIQDNCALHKREKKHPDIAQIH